MRYLFLIVSFLFLFISFDATAQKKAIDHTSYDLWEDVSSYKMSENGKYLTYTKTFLKGNDTGYVYDVAKQSIIFTIPRIKRLTIDASEQLLTFEVKADYDSIRKLKLDGVKTKDLPEDTLKYYIFEADTTYTVFPYKNFEVNKEQPWIAYRTEKEQCSCDKKKKKRKKKKEEEFETDGAFLTLINPISGKKKYFEGVTKYDFSEQGNYFTFVTHCKHTDDSLYMHVVDLDSLDITRMYAGQGELSDIGFDEKDQQITFIASEDTSEVKAFEVYYYKIGTDSAQKIIDTLTPNMPENWSVDDRYSPRFSHDGSRLFVGISFFEDEAPEDTLLDSEKAKVDIWHYQDDRIQPRQLDQIRYDENREFKAVFDIASKKMTVLEDSSLFYVQLLDHGNANKALGIDSKPYQKYMSFAYPWGRDYYLVNLSNGERKLLKDSVTHNAEIDPKGKFFVYYNAADTNWYVIETTNLKENCLTCTIDENFATDVNGAPYHPYANGHSGWLEDGRMILEARRDLWVVDPTFERTPYNITQNKGDENDIRFQWANMERDSSYIQLEETLLIGTNDSTKEVQIFTVDNFDTFAHTKIYEGDFKLRTLKKLNGKPQFIFRHSTLQDYPDLQLTTDNFKTVDKVTEYNQQQEEYQWAHVQQVYWEAYDGKSMRGLLYTPENLDTTKKYPMLVYFYERNSDMMHHYYTPKPTASIIYPTEYASNDYVVFIPDVEYEPGHPAKSAYNCIVSGTDAMIDQFPFIDSTKMGLQGQSWGGYQTAQLITMTDKYAAAMAGAPVSNMFSAYGGIRWGSGLSRQFQYERTQSRIGATIWEKPELYIENSPVFHLPNVTTPVLIMHNDDDGAVPWYQGIEMYMGLRRLNKPVWMLNYNGDQHNLMETANRRDLSRRMKQFFDHFLQDAPAPVWLDEGIPAVKKQKDYGFDIPKEED